MGAREAGGGGGVTEGKRKRGSYMLLWLLTEFYCLAPIRLFFFNK